MASHDIILHYTVRTSCHVDLMIICALLFMVYIHRGVHDRYTVCRYILIIVLLWYIYHTCGIIGKSNIWQIALKMQLASILMKIIPHL